MFKSIRSGVLSFIVLAGISSQAATLNVDLGQLKAMALAEATDPNTVIQRLNISFGTIGVNQTLYSDVRLTAGDVDVKINKIVYAGSMFSASSNCPDILKAKQSCFTTVRYWPSFEGYHTGYLDFHMDNGKILIDLSGWARRGY